MEEAVKRDVSLKSSSNKEPKRAEPASQKAAPTPQKATPAAAKKESVAVQDMEW